MEITIDSRAVRRALQVLGILTLLALVGAGGLLLGRGEPAGGAARAAVTPTPGVEANAAATPDGGAASASRLDPAVAETLRATLAETLSYGSPPADSGRVHEVTLVAAPHAVPLLAGVEGEAGVTTDVWAYNGQVPGPELRITHGDRLRVTLENELPVPTTIHWHGVRVPNAMDGVPGVTQPPVAPGETFVYEFTPPDPGTYWYHPHVRSSEEVERGLYGVLVVEEVEPPPYVRDEVWVIDDWLLTDDGQIYPEFNTGRDLMHDGRWGNLLTVDSRVDATLSVQAGERLRLRLVNPSNGRHYRPDLGPLEAQVIAVDGLPVRAPLAPDALVLAPGNRIDLDLTVPPSLAGQTVEVFDRFTRQPVRLALIEVAEDTVETPDFDPPIDPTLPDWRAALDLPLDGQLVLDAARGGELGIQWRINGRAFGQHEPLPLTEGQFARWQIRNDSGRLHPMHIHGQFFQVLARNGQPTDEGVWRDTVLVAPRETVDIGLVPIDRGPWATHCHILEHAEAGMMTVTEVDPPPLSAPADG